MNRSLTALSFAAIVLAIELAGVQVNGQAANTIAAQVAAAQAVAGDTWLTIESELCGPAQGGPGRAALAPRVYRREVRKSGVDVRSRPHQL